MKRSARLVIPLAAALLLPAAALASTTPSATQRASGTAPATNKQIAATTTQAKPASRHWFGTKATGEKTHSRIDLNTAAKEDLTKLPGVDDALADQIIAGRPYKAKTDLLTKKIVTKEEFSKISARVATKPAHAGK